MTFPLLKPQSPSHPSTLSSKLDGLLQSCELLDSNHPTHEELTQNFLFFHKNLENLKRPKKSVNFSIPSKNVDNYIKTKFKSNEIPVKEIMTSPQNPAKLSFAGFNEAETSKTLRKYKRKFAENWKEVYFSQEFVKITEKVVKSNERKTAPDVSRKSVLEGIIKDYMGKKLGLARRRSMDEVRMEPEVRVERKEFRSRTCVEGQQRRVLRKSSKVDVEREEDENEYLVPGFNEWAKDTSNRLMLEKLIREQHQKERRHQLMGGLQELRLMKYESMSTKFID